jgi:3-hydroxypropionyl-CoA synthetase (ADP-forming)
MPWFVFQDEPLEEKIIYYLGEFSEQGRKPLLVGGNGAPYTNKISRLIEKHHIPVYDDIRNWVAAAAALYNLYNWGKQKNSHHA